MNQALHSHVDPEDAKDFEAEKTYGITAAANEKMLDYMKEQTEYQHELLESQKRLEEGVSDLLSFFRADWSKRNGESEMTEAVR